MNEQIWIVGYPAEMLFEHLTPTARTLLEFTGLAERLYATGEEELAEAMEQLHLQPADVGRVRAILAELLDEEAPAAGRVEK